MSSYTRVAWNPKERVARAAIFADNYFGPYEYGVMFSGDPVAYRTHEVEIPIDLELVPRNYGEWEKA